MLLTLKSLSPSVRSPGITHCLTRTAMPEGLQFIFILSGSGPEFEKKKSFSKLFSKNVWKNVLYVYYWTWILIRHFVCALKIELEISTKSDPFSTIGFCNDGVSKCCLVPRFTYFQQCSTLFQCRRKQVVSVHILTWDTLKFTFCFIKIYFFIKQFEKLGFQKCSNKIIGRLVN